MLLAAGLLVLRCLEGCTAPLSAAAHLLLLVKWILAAMLQLLYGHSHVHRMLLAAGLLVLSCLEGCTAPLSAAARLLLLVK